MDEPLVSIYVPTYEPNSLFLHEALSSIRNQTEGRFQVFIHDDASRVDVRALVSPFLEDERFHFARSITHRGIGGNWNACLQYGSAPFIQYLFQDDAWYPQYLARSLAALRSGERVGFVASEHQYLCEEDLPIASFYKSLPNLRRSLLWPEWQNGKHVLLLWLRCALDPNLIGEPSFVMMRRSAMQAAGRFAEDMPQFLDCDYWVRLLLHTDLAYLPEASGVFRVHRRGTSFRNFESGEGVFDRFRCLGSLRMHVPPGSEEEKILREVWEQLFTEVVGHVVNRLLRGRHIGKGAWPFLCYLARRPLLALWVFGHYGFQASRRWRLKACRMLGLKDQLPVPSPSLRQV